MTDSTEHVDLPQWRYAPDAWRWVRRLDDRRLGLLLRARSARVMPNSMRERFLLMGIPADILDATLADIRSHDDWPASWVETAQRFLGDYRRQVSAKQLVEAAQARRLAALSYHAAQIFGTGDRRTERTCRAAAASLFFQAMPYVYPDARRILIPWRSHELPAYLHVPGGLQARTGLVVMLNGASMSKEETFGWSENFLRAGLAVLAIDGPGSGEASGVPNPDQDENDLLDGVFEVMQRHPSIDLAQVSVVGVSLGGNLAIRCAAYDRRIMCAVAVTPPYDPARWIAHASPILLRQLGEAVGETSEDFWRSLEQFSLHDAVPLVMAPILVFGAAKDVVIPPGESQLLAARAGSLGSLVWYRSSGHCLYDAMSSWTNEAATWISSVAAARAIEYQATGSADPATVSASAREELTMAGAIDDDFFDDRGSARLIAPDDFEGEDSGSSARLIDQKPQASAEEP